MRSLQGMFLSLNTLACLTSATGQAETIFQTGPEKPFVFNGGPTINSSQWIANYFTVNDTVQVTDIGGMFTYASSKPNFGALVSSLPNQNLNWYRSNIDTIALAHASFTIPSANGGANVDVPLSVTLNAGTYALIFGAGTTANPIFGASGSAILTDCDSGDPGNELLIKGNFPVQMSPNPDAYMFVHGTLATAAVPEPTTGALFGLAILLLGIGTMRGRNAKKTERA